jgi:hypothetical protein
MLALTAADLGLQNELSALTFPRRFDTFSRDNCQPDGGKERSPPHIEETPTKQLEG